MKTYTNPNPKLHIGLLSSQFKVMSTVHKRMITENRIAEAKMLEIEFIKLIKLMIRKTFEKHWPNEIHKLGKL